MLPRSILASLLTLLLLCVQPSSAAALRLDALIGEWLKHPALQHSNVGVELMELPSGKVLYSFNGHKRFTPASTAKVFTTACAYETLGANFTYKTQLVGDPYIVDGRVRGDIILAPSQDPTMTRDDLMQLVKQLQEKKIRVIDGHVKIAAVPGGHNQYSPGWLIEDFGQPWMAVCSNLVVDHNIAQGTSGLRGVKVVKVEPDAEYNAVFASLMNSEVASAWLIYDPSYNTMKVYCGEGTTLKSPLVVCDPDQYNMALLDMIIADHGIHIDKGLGKHPAAVETDKPPAVGVQTLAEHVSKPLSAIITTTLHESDNLYAQQILRTLGLLSQDHPVKNAKVDDRTTIEDRALYRLNTWLASLKIPPREVILMDGCGLTRKNGVSPHSLNMVLAHMAGPNVTGGYLNLLKTGEGNYRYKTGSMDTARSITGVIQTAGGQNLALTIMVNNHTPSIKELRVELAELVNLVGRISSISTKVTTPTDVHVIPTNEAEGPVKVELAAPAHSAHAPSKRRKRSRH